MKVVVFGGRDFTNYRMLREKLDNILSEVDNVTIVSGAARGADTLGERYALERGLDVEKYPALWAQDGRSAGFKRNARMAQIATHSVAFWDGRSKGTKHMIDLMSDRPQRVIRYTKGEPQ